MKCCLIEPEVHPELSQFVQGTRIVYQCVDISEHFFGFGTSAGDVVIFRRSDHKLLRRIACANGRVIKLCFNPQNDNIVCIASNRGILNVIEHNSLSERSNFGHRIIFTCTLHSGKTLVDLIWSDAGSHFITGDDAGLVSISDIYAINDAVIFDISPSVTIQLESAITQLDVYSDRLLMSTVTASYLCDVNDKKYARIGKKARSGVYGACFGCSHLQHIGREYPSAFVSRPGGRIWKVNEYGAVECTLNLRNDNSTHINHPLFQHDGSVVHSEGFDHKINIGRVYLLDEFLLTFNDETCLILQIYEDEIPCVIWQTTHFAGKIADVRIEGRTIFILDKKGKFREWRFVTDVLSNVYYTLPNIQLRCSIIGLSLMRKEFFAAVESFRRELVRGKELIVRDTSGWILTTNCRTGQRFYITCLMIMKILQFVEQLNFTKKLFLNLPFVIKLASNQPVLESPLCHEVIQANVKDIEILNDVDTGPSLRRTHKRFLISLIEKMQDKIADSLLVEVVGTFWAQKPSLEIPTGHYLDSPITEWGIRTDLRGCCDVCEMPLIIEGVDNDLQVHFCGHKMHAVCNFTQNACYMCS